MGDFGWENMGIWWFNRENFQGFFRRCNWLKNWLENWFNWLKNDGLHWDLSMKHGFKHGVFSS